MKKIKKNLKIKSYKLKNKSSQRLKINKLKLNKFRKNQLKLNLLKSSKKNNMLSYQKMKDNICKINSNNNCHCNYFNTKINNNN